MTDQTDDRALAVAAKLRAMATNYPAGHLWDKLDAKTCLEAALLLDGTHPRLLPPDVSRLVHQVRALCAATLRAGPGVAVEIPAELAEEGRKFMRGEPNLIVQMPFADVSSLGELLADNPQYS